MKKAKKITSIKGTKMKFKLNRELDKYENVVFFPEKLEECNKMIKKFGLPK